MVKFNDQKAVIYTISWGKSILERHTGISYKIYTVSSHSVFLPYTFTFPLIFLDGFVAH